jgi:hypothetical protein
LRSIIPVALKVARRKSWTARQGRLTLQTTAECRL